jgi:hypothetical protein
LVGDEFEQVLDIDDPLVRVALPRHAMEADLDGSLLEFWAPRAQFSEQFHTAAVNLFTSGVSFAAPQCSNLVDAAYRDVDSDLDHLSAALGIQHAA